MAPSECAIASNGNPQFAAMTLGYEYRLLLTYATNLARRTRYPSDRAGKLMQEVVLGETFAELREVVEPSQLLFKKISRLLELPCLDEARHGDDRWREFCGALNELESAAGSIPPSLPVRRIRILGELLNLTPEDIRVLEAYLFEVQSPAVSRFIDFVRGEFGESVSRHCGLVRVGNPHFAHMLGIPLRTFQDRLGPDSPLVRNGLLAVDDDLDINMPGCLNRLHWSQDEDADVRELLLGRSQTTDLEWSDFDHLGEGRDDIESILRGAAARGTKGVNILLHGPPGTGKTTFCKALAGRAGLSLFSVGEIDEWGREPVRRERLAKLRLSQNLLGGDRSTVLLLDEMDDVLSGNDIPLWFFGGEGNRRGGESRVYLHRLLENTPVPTLWTTNGARGIDPAILRRMTFAIELRLPPVSVRTRIWSRQLARRGIEVGDVDARSLAEEFEATPGVAEGAVMAGELGGGGFEQVRRSVQGLARVLDCDRPRFSGSNGFDPGLSCADIDLTHLTDQLGKSKNRRFSLCLQGPPGTGKSAYARYLAERLDMEVLHKRASDLLDMYVGQSERNIADAFAEARDSEAFLVFDEADSLLADRGRAHRSWEISQVNEMLTWMESHPLPFACTTNLVDLLDNATLRRFVFKITLDYLAPVGVEAAFRKWFGLAPPPGLASLEMLTPGDFEVVRRKARMLGQEADGEALVNMLHAECIAKPGRSVPIGFVR